MFATVDKDALRLELIHTTGQILTMSQLEVALEDGKSVFPPATEKSVREMPEKVIALDFRSPLIPGGVTESTTAAVARVGGEVVILFIGRKQSRYESVNEYNFSTLLKHEIVHYHQVLEGRLVVERLSEDGTVDWEGKTYQVYPISDVLVETNVAEATFRLVKYMSQPWELEAQRGCWALNNLDEMEHVVEELGTCWKDEWDEELFKKDLEEGGIAKAYGRYGYSGHKENAADFNFSERCIEFFVQNPAHLMKLAMPAQALCEKDGVYDLREYNTYLPDVDILNRLNKVVIDKTMTVKEMVMEIFAELRRIDTDESRQIVDALTISGFAE